MLYRVTVDVRFYFVPNTYNYLDYNNITVESPLDNTVESFKKSILNEEVIKDITSVYQIDPNRTKFCRNSYNDPVLNDNNQLVCDKHIFAVLYDSELEN